MTFLFRIGLLLLVTLPDSFDESPGKVTPSKETTYVTGPLLPDGSVDFLEAVNLEMSKGVLPEENAAIPLWRAFGPGPIPEELRERFFEKLGMEVPDAQGNYFIPLSEWEDERQPEAEERFQQLQKYRDQFQRRRSDPELAAWIALNETALDQIVEASRLPRIYSPMLKEVGRDPPAMMAIFYLVPRISLAVKALKYRSLLLAGEGNYDAAWQDILACHRLARLVGQMPFSLTLGVSDQIENRAAEAAATLIHDGELTASQLQRIMGDLDQLPPLPLAADGFESGDRLVLLDAIQYSKQVQLPEQLGSIGMWLFNCVVDWNRVMGNVNSTFDELVATLRIPDYGVRTANLKKLGDRFSQLKKQFENGERYEGLVESGLVNKAKISDRVSELSLSLMLPSFSVTNQNQSEAVTAHRLERIQAAVELHRETHGRYPQTLLQISPKLRSNLLLDGFDQPVVYKRDEKYHGFQLYSVGPDLIDGDQTDFDFKTERGDIWLTRTSFGRLSVWPWMALHGRSLKEWAQTVLVLACVCALLVWFVWRLGKLIKRVA